MITLAVHPAGTTVVSGRGDWARLNGRGPHPEKNNPRTAYDVQEAHRLLSDFNDDQLKRIPVLPAGSRLEQDATYIDLADPERREFTATSGMEAAPQSLLVPKSEVDYQLWNCLRGVTDPARTGAVPGT